MARRRNYESRSDGGYGYRYQGGQHNYRRRERKREERQVEVVAFGAVIVLFAIGLLTQALRSDIISVIGGAIFLGAAVYQWQRRWRVNPVTWIGGLIMFIVGLYAMQNHTDVPMGMLFPLGMFAIIIVASAVSGEF